MKYSGALCSSLELRRQYFQELHNKFESLSFKKSPSITSGTSTPQSFKTSFKNARNPHVSSTKQGSFFPCSDFISPPGQGQALPQHPLSLWPSEPPAQPPSHFTAKKPRGPWQSCQQILGVCDYPWEHHRACRARPQDYFKQNHHFRSNSKGLQISRRLQLSHR